MFRRTGEQKMLFTPCCHNSFSDWMNEMCLIHFYARVHISYVRRKYLEHRKMEIKLIGFGLLFSAKSLAETQLRFFLCRFSLSSVSIVFGEILITFWHCVNHMSKMSSSWHFYVLGHDKRTLLLGQLQKKCIQSFSFHSSIRSVKSI